MLSVLQRHRMKSAQDEMPSKIKAPFSLPRRDAQKRRSIFHRANRSHEKSAGSWKPKEKVQETLLSTGTINSRLTSALDDEGVHPSRRGTNFVSQRTAYGSPCRVARVRAAQKSESPLNTGRRDGSFHVERSRLNDNASVARSRKR